MRRQFGRNLVYLPYYLFVTIKDTSYKYRSTRSPKY